MKGRRAGVVATLGGVLGVAGVTAYVRSTEPWFRCWGTTTEESTGKLPVDDLVISGTRSTTRAITVHAPIEDAWSWLVQIGQDRAGFYSYSVLENIVGAGMHNASSVHSEWQERQRGDSVWLADPTRWHERGRQVVALVDPPRALVLVSPRDFARLERGERAGGAWGFVLEPRGEYRTRLLVRTSGGAVGTHLFDGLHFVMEQKMMRGLRDRAEAATS